MFVVSFILWICFAGGVLIGAELNDTLKYQILLSDSVCKKWSDSTIYEKKMCEMSEIVKKYGELRKGWEQMHKEKAIEMMKKTEEMEKVEEILKEKMREMLKKSEKMRKKVKELKVVGIERFDDTGLIRGNVKYFIRIWKHPPKEFFNMPMFRFNK